MEMFLLLLKRGKGDDFSLFILQNLHGVFLNFNSVWSAKITFLPNSNRKKAIDYFSLFPFFPLCTEIRPQ